VADSRAQAQVMEATAGKFESSNAQLQQMLSTLLSELDGLRSSWQGSGAAAFEQVKLRYQDDQKALQNALTETAGAIRTAGRHYAATDSAAADRIGGSHRGGHDLPL
jgi:WXG100 family type VII secretion target